MVAQLDASILRIRPRKYFGRLAAWALIEGRQVTTKGQWINPVVFGFYRACQALSRRKGSDRPIFIVGTGRSGTTILGRIMGLHRDCAFLNEPKAAWNFAYPDEDMIGSYSTGPARVFLDRNDADNAIAEKLEHIYSVAMQIAGAKRPVDKYPELLFRIPFALTLFPAGRFVAILRDGADTCASVTAWSRRKGEVRGEEAHDWWGRDGRKWRLIVQQIVPRHPDLAHLQEWLATVTDQRDRSAVEWIVSMRTVLAAQAAATPEMLAVKYEDLCERPDEILARIFAHCDLAPDAAVNAYAKDVLTEAPSYAKLELAAELVEPFNRTLIEVGYADSVQRVCARA